ncbi:hypothetical protein GCM10010420_11440 [Streptomyces glaucosporus]|uniref:Streptomyces killer toxin-like beta/gamma crystallin domain-containing protein n=1 Tax=Streptomyces glaucosporus TaxID=284044 RepID=A0ABN3HWV6_9ACTN
MKDTLKKSAVVAAAAATTAVCLPAGSAHALSRVLCDSLDYLMIGDCNSTRALCFADAGTQQVNIYAVNDISSGDNKVTVKYQAVQNGPIAQFTPEKWEWADAEKPLHGITGIRIW